MRNQLVRGQMAAGMSRNVFEWNGILNSGLRRSRLAHACRTVPLTQAARSARSYSKNIVLRAQETRSQPSQRSPHGQWYADIVPAMIPVAILGSAVYLGLQLAQLHLANEKYLDGAEKRIQELEDELLLLRIQRDRREKETNPSSDSVVGDKERGWWFSQS